MRGGDREADYQWWSEAGDGGGSPMVGVGDSSPTV